MTAQLSSPPPAVGEWKMVPIEPTQAMQEAGIASIDANQDAPLVYRAMLAAAPASPSPPRDAVVEAAREFVALFKKEDAEGVEIPMAVFTPLAKLLDALAALEQEKNG